MSEEAASAHAQRWLRLRIGFLTLGLIGLFGLVLQHMYQLQVSGGEDLEARGSSQSSGSMQLESHRGSILDRQGNELAVSIEVASIYAHPRQVEAPLEVAQALHQILGVPLDELLGKLQSERGFVWIARKVTPAQGEAVRALEMRGVGLEHETRRFYPLQGLGAHLLGFVGLDNEGLGGLEARHDETLRGGSVTVRGVRDARGKMLMVLESPQLNALEGNSMTLTIDPRIQRIAEVAIERAARENRAKAAVAVVMDARTGELLAMANWPPFNPNRFRDHTPSEWRERITQDAYEPGSVFKTFLYALALDRGVVTPETPIDAEGGALRIGEHEISDTHTVEGLNAEGVVVHSSNVGAYKLARELGREAFHGSLEALGFGARWGVGLPGESAGLLWPHERWPEITLANVAFGHGVSVTALQLTAALGALANDGVLMRPLLVREIRSRDGEVIERNEPEALRRVFSERAARLTRRAMEKVVTEGTGMRAWVEGYRVGGKTGTPQKVHGGRYVDRWMANFIGLAPIESPAIAVVVMVDEPQASHLGGVVAAPAFAEIVSQTLPYLGVYPDPVYTGDALRLPTVVASAEAGDAALEAGGDEAGDAALEAGADEAGDAALGVGADGAALGRDGAQEAAPPRAPLAPRETLVPDFAGLSLPAALELAREVGLHIEPRDSGFVVEQWPAPGTQVAERSPIQLTLSHRYRQAHLGFGP